MTVRRFANKLVLLFLLQLTFFCTNSLAIENNNVIPEPFRGDTPDAIQTIDYEGLNQIYSDLVLDMGPSSRGKYKKEYYSAGTKFRNSIKVHTSGEGNRFLFESFDTPKKKALLTNLKKQLTTLPTQIPLNQFSKDEQLAYWLNVYNIALLNEVVAVYPKRNLKDWLTGEKSILHKKILTVSNINLSLYDIQYKILKHKYKSNPLIIYGLYQGNIGSPNIRKEAYTGKNVYKNLESNAREFVNSNRGVFKPNFPHNDKLQVSSFYEQNKEYLELSNSQFISHISQYANSYTRDLIHNTKGFRTSISNWQIADLYGTTRTYGGGSKVDIWQVSNNEATLKRSIGKISQAQLSRIAKLLKIRAVNFGGGSVTVTDLPDQIEEVDDKTEN